MRSALIWERSCADLSGIVEDATRHIRLLSLTVSGFLQAGFARIFKPAGVRQLILSNCGHPRTAGLARQKRVCAGTLNVSKQRKHGNCA